MVKEKLSYKDLINLSAILNPISSDAVQLRMLEYVLRDSVLDRELILSRKTVKAEKPEKTPKKAKAKAKAVTVKKTGRAKKAGKAKMPDRIARQLTETKNEKVAAILKKAARKHQLKGKRKGTGNLRNQYRPLKKK